MYVAMHVYESVYGSKAVSLHMLSMHTLTMLHCVTSAASHFNGA